tara:strand:- start:31 stop:276 length:246 start_codon:yes stop_codon:yes gene_type:complete
MIKPLTTEPPLNPPETDEDRKFAKGYALYRSLKNLHFYVKLPDENELELQHTACQARDDDEIDRDMHGEDGSLNLASVDGG